MDEAVQHYIDSISSTNRPLFDRLDGLIRTEFPNAVRSISYQMPTYSVGERRLYVGAWKHGLSIYGWDQDRNVAFVERHADLSNGRGTIKLPPTAMAAMDDDELRELIRGALDD